jgi:hypothetical protein
VCPFEPLETFWGPGRQECIAIHQNTLSSSIRLILSLLLDTSTLVQLTLVQYSKHPTKNRSRKAIGKEINVKTKRDFLCSTPVLDKMFGAIVIAALPFLSGASIMQAILGQG